MSKVKIDNVAGCDTEYIIRDEANITIGRFNIIEYSKENRATAIRLKYYRVSQTELLTESLIIINRTIFKDSAIHKINVLVSDLIPTNEFLNLGYVLEGIMTDNMIVNGVQRDELIFGITKEDFSLSQRYSIVSIPGQRISIRSLDVSDAEEMLEFYKRNSAYLSKFEPKRDSSFYTIENQQSILKESYKELMKGTGVTFGIIKDDKIIGRIKISDIVYGVLKSCYIGYALDESFQGKGYMKEAVNLALDYIFDELNLHRVEASTLVDNYKSQSVLEGCGFKKLGLNEKYLYINGSWQDHITFYKVNS